MRNLLSILGVTCGGLVLLYVALVALTMYFASARTELTQAAEATEEAIRVLESDYYAALGRITGQDPIAIGFDYPIRVEYVSLGEPALSRANSGLTP